MLDGEALAPADKVLVRRHSLLQFDQKFGVVVARLRVVLRTDVVQDAEHAGWVLCLDEVAHNLVVEVVDLLPLDPLAHVFLLLGLQRELDEDLLELLIDKVDAELLEPVVLEHFEPVDVEDANQEGRLVSVAHFQRLVDLAHNPREQAIVDCLGQRVACCTRLLAVERHVVLLACRTGTCGDLAERDGPFQLSGAGRQEGGRRLQHWPVVLSDSATRLPFLHKPQVAQVKNTSNEREHRILLSVVQANDGHGVLGDLEVRGVVHALEDGALPTPRVLEVVGRVQLQG
mmetsp:Transcript_45984/g.115760  ORF Transcript_45984/g.115760 Transcript_45984/m.115760 type:complete len:287 (-) Transcript_45984:724-1584(-)